MHNLLAITWYILIGAKVKSGITGKTVFGHKPNLPVMMAIPEENRVRIYCAKKSTTLMWWYYNVVVFLATLQPTSAYVWLIQQSIRYSRTSPMPQCTIQTYELPGETLRLHWVGSLPQNNTDAPHGWRSLEYVKEGVCSIEYPFSHTLPYETAKHLSKVINSNLLQALLSSGLLGSVA